MSVVLSSDGQLLTGSKDGFAFLSDCGTGRMLMKFTWKESLPVRSVARSLDGKLIAVSWETTVKLWNSSNALNEKWNVQTTTIRGHTDSVRSMVFSADGRLLLTGSKDTTAMLWNAATGEKIQTFHGHGQGPVNAVALSLDGKYVVTGSEDHVARQWNAENGDLLQTFRGHTGSVTSVVLSSHGQFLVTGSVDHTMKRWNFKTGNLIRSFDGHAGPVWSMALFLNDKYLVTSSEDCTIKVWTVNTGEAVEIYVSRDDPAYAVAVSSDCKFLVAGFKSGSAKRFLFPRYSRSDAAEGAADLLNIKPQTDAIADALALEDMEPPLVVGMLGDWGTGKTFAMNLIRKRLGEISELDVSSSDDFKFVGHIYSVQFNASTYANDDIWAGVMYRVLYDLNEQLSMQDAIHQWMEGQRQDMKKKGLNHFELMRLKSGERQALQNYLKSNAIPGDVLLHAMNHNNGNATGALVRALRQGYEMDIQSIPKKRKELKELKREIALRTTFPLFGRSVQELFSNHLAKYRKAHPGDDNIINMLNDIAWWDRWPKFFFGGLREMPFCELVVIVVAAIAVIAVLPGFIETFHMQYTAFVLIPVVYGLVSSIQKGYNTLIGDSVTATIAVVQESARTAQEEGTVLGDLRSQRRILESEVNAIANRMWLEEGDSLLDVVRKRVMASAYENKQLGIVHQAQKDLVQLSEAMMRSGYDQSNPTEQNASNFARRDGVLRWLCRSPSYYAEQGLWSMLLDYFVHCVCRKRSWTESKAIPASAKTPLFPRGNPRIVLFVDDVDRCPPDTVVKVLEVLQFLVKTKLFVAVVALDLRHVTRSLEAVYKGILDEPWGIQYVQNIVQIPYIVPRVNPMDMQFYVMESQMQTKDDAEEETKQGDAEKANNTVEEETKQGHAEEVYPTSTGNDDGNAGAAGPVDSSTIFFHKDEVQIMKRACMTAGTNYRAAKGLVNVYKLLKGIWRNTNSKEPVPDVKEVIVLLLALTWSYPLIMSEVLATLEQSLELPPNGSNNIMLETSVHDFVIDRLTILNAADRCPKIWNAAQEWPHSVAGVITMGQLGLDNVRLVRTFSFVGDLSPSRI